MGANQTCQDRITLVVTNDRGAGQGITQPELGPGSFLIDGTDLGGPKVCSWQHLAYGSMIKADNGVKFYQGIASTYYRILGRYYPLSSSLQEGIHLI